MSRKIVLAAIPAALTLMGSVLAEETGMREMVVSASRTQEAKREVTSNVTVITEQDIKASAASSLADVMTAQGFVVMSSGGTSSIMIRGYGANSMAYEVENQVLLLINGVRVGTSNIALIGLANIERVEVIRGPAAVQYGSSALGGVVNVVLKRGVEGSPTASVEFGAGSNGLLREQAAVTGAIGAFDLAAGYSNSPRGSIKTANFGTWNHTDMDRNESGNLAFGYTFANNQRIAFNYFRGYQDFYLTDSGGVRASAYNKPTAKYYDYTKLTQTTALTYTGNTDDKKFNWSANYTAGEEIQNFVQSSGYTQFVDNRQFNSQVGYNGEHVSISGGLDSIEYKQYISTKPALVSRTTDTGLYYSGKLRILDERLIFSMGGRYDKYDDYGPSQNASQSHFGGSYGIAFHPTSWLKLRTNYTDGFKMPSARQRTGDGNSYAPNPNVQPEKSKTWEVGGDIDWRALTGSLTYFNSEYKDKIVGGASGTKPSYWFTNISGATLAGVEGSLRADIGKALGKNWSLTPYGGFTWLGTRRNNDYANWHSYKINGRFTNILVNTPEWMFSYGVDFADPDYKVKGRVHASTYGEIYTSSSYVVRPSGTIVNMSLDKELMGFSDSKGTMTLRTEITNLFNGANEVYYGYPGAGRSYYVGLRYDFK